MADELLHGADFEITQDKVICKMGEYLHSDDLSVNHDVINGGRPRP